MKLYILEVLIPWIPNYDTVQGVIVCASCEENARKLASTAAGDEGKEAWLDPKKTSCCSLIPTCHEQIIMVDFHEGP